MSTRAALAWHAIWLCLVPGIATAQQAAPCADVRVQSFEAAPAALVYLWSPRMVLSVTQADALAEAARARGLQFVALLDPRVPPAEARAALARHAASGASSHALDPCAVAHASQFTPEDWHHAPTMRLWLNGKPHGRRIVGVMPTAALRALLSERMAQ